MAKLAFTEKQLAAEFKFEVTEMGGEIFYNEDSGISVLILPNDKMNGFVRIYVAYCSPMDKFSKKRARLVLQNRVYYGNYILFPVLYAGFYSIIAERFLNTL